MHKPFLRFILILALLPACSRAADYKVNFSSTKHEEERVAVYKLNQNDIETMNAARKAMHLPETKTSILIDKKDINNDGSLDILAYIYSAYHCGGNRGCVFAAYLVEPQGYREVLKTVIPSEDVQILETLHRGVHDIKTILFPKYPEKDLSYQLWVWEKDHYYAIPHHSIPSFRR